LPLSFHFAGFHAIIPFGLRVSFWQPNRRAHREVIYFAFYRITVG